MTDLSARYGRRNHPRWLLPTIAAVGIIIGVAWVLWVVLSDNSVKANVFGYEVTDANHAVIKIDVHRPDPIAVECSVYAQSEDHTIVGERNVTLPASKTVDIRKSITVETDRRAVMVALRTCHPKN